MLRPTRMPSPSGGAAATARMGRVVFTGGECRGRKRMQRRMRMVLSISIFSALTFILPSVAVAQSPPPPPGSEQPSTPDSVKRGDANDTSGANKKKDSVRKDKQGSPPPGGSTTEPVPNR